MQIPKLPDLRTALQWSRANWLWIIAWILLPTVVVLALMAWHRKKKCNPTPGPSPDGRGDATNAVAHTKERSTSPLPSGEGPGVGLTTDNQEPTTDNQ